MEPRVERGGRHVPKNNERGGVDQLELIKTKCHRVLEGPKVVTASVT